MVDKNIIRILNKKKEIRKIRIPEIKFVYLSMKRVQEIHKLLRKAKYFYYEKHECIMPDYEFDMLEVEYNKLCDENNIAQEQRVTNFVGFSIMIPMRL